MEVLKIVAIVAALAVSVVGLALFVRAIAHIVSVIRMGQPTLGRTDNAGRRWANLVKESLVHTRMLQLKPIGVLHWFVMVGFIGLVLTLVNAYGQLFNPYFTLPIIGHFFLYEWFSEFLAWVTLIGIIALIINRFAVVGPQKGRFFGSRTWQAVYVEMTILVVGICIATLRGLEYQLFGDGDRFHFPLTWFLIPGGLSTETLENAIVLVAAVKIIASLAWMVVLGLNTTMGVAWHRFTAWVNIWFKRESDGSTALGALQPVNVGGKELDFEDIEDLDEDAALGVGKIEDFTWKGILDFTSCTECGRCQAQCPAWHTDKPLSPKLLIMGLREHAYAKAPYLQAAEDARESLPEALRNEAARPLVGPNPSAIEQAHGKPITAGEDGLAGVIDPDVLWSCTSCGACVQQCPVDIEHVDHIMDMRRYQVMLESDFPSELNQLFKGLESKGNPWNMNPRKRMEWAKDLPFEVPVVGEDVEDLTEVEYLFWVGCAGAFEDRAVKTTKAVAELLHTAGVKFAVMGNGETCTGDPARRSGNEFVFQQLAMENAEMLKEFKAHKVVTACAHCLNTLKNEYPQVGVELEVVHHTQLLNRLVRDGRLTPVAPTGGSIAGREITYHDPCYIGRHNGVYDPPRELLGMLPGTNYTEMPRHRERSFCCGAGGARMWMEETIGTRINVDRTEEALATGANTIATGCPFCRVMLSDGLTSKQQDGQHEEVEVIDVSQLLLESVRRGQEPAEPAATS